MVGLFFIFGLSLLPLQSGEVFRESFIFAPYLTWYAHLYVEIECHKEVHASLPIPGAKESLSSGKL